MKRDPQNRTFFWKIMVTENAGDVSDREHVSVLELYQGGIREFVGCLEVLM